VSGRAQLGQSVTAVEGENFSGRSELLRLLANAPGTSVQPGHQADERQNAWLGIDAHNYLSGLVQTVGAELELHGIDDSDRRASVRSLLEPVGLSSLLARNPLTLSGGEQVVLALATATLATRDLLAIDCALEQLSPTVRSHALGVLTALGHAGVRTVLADNRLREFRSQVAVASAASLGAPEPRLRPPGLAAARLDDPPAAESIRLDDVTFRYRKGPAVLRGVSFTFEPGQVYFLKGPNGIGKSTLGKLLCGLIKPERGAVLDGHGRALRPWRSPGHTVGYHFQNPDLQLFSTSVAQEFASGGTDVVAAFGLQECLGAHPHDLPFVLRKRVAVAAAFARRRPWLILDEPILGQDDRTALELAAMLSRVAVGACGLIVITHSEWFRTLVHQARILRLTADGLTEEHV